MEEINMKLNTTFSKVYKDSEMVLVIEDDVITTAKIYKNNECIFVGDVECDDYPNGVPFSKSKSIYKTLMSKIDKMAEVEML